MGVLNLSLSDRTAVVCGPFGPLMQNLASALSENGADVALVVAPDQLNFAQKFCQNLMDLREVSEKYGRSAAIESNFSDQKSAQDAFSRSAEIFGTTDIYIDTQMLNLNIGFRTGATLNKAEAAFSERFNKAHVTSQVALSFVRNRSKSRILYLTNNLDLNELSHLGSTKGQELTEYILKMAQETAKDHITVNALSVGISEDYLLQNSGSGSPSASVPIQKTLRELQAKLPGARLVDYSDISASISFMVSPLSSAINGQMITVNHGLKFPANT